MNLDETLKENNIFVPNPVFLNGDGFIEEGAVVYGRLNSRFFVGSYSQISGATLCKNSFIGRFTVIEKNCSIGYRKIRKGMFSNHPFSSNLTFKAEDEYYKKIKTTRFFYEENKYTFIGSDVFIGEGSLIEEGVVIGDGAIIHPHSYVTSNVPPYAIVSGSPAQIIDYRFPSETISKLCASKWWKHDISRITGKYKSGFIDYCANDSLLDSITTEEFPVLERKRLYINTNKGIAEENQAKNVIIGPSHIDIWYARYQKGQLKKPNNYHLVPISALSLFSDQLKNLIDWWSEWFSGVLLFVPDFRIGNVSIDNPIKDGRFIKKELISEENSIKCYELGISRLDEYAAYGNVKFWFWSVNGREEFSQSKGEHIGEDGAFRHPIWNYSDLIEKYSHCTIDVREYFPTVLDQIVDGSIHPTNACYRSMIPIFDAIDWKQDKESPAA